MHGLLVTSRVDHRPRQRARLAAAIGDELGCPVRGRATPMLKETRAPAVVIECTEVGDDTGDRVVNGIERFFSQVTQTKNRR